MSNRTNALLNSLVSLVIDNIQYLSNEQLNQLGFLSDSELLDRDHRDLELEEARKAISDIANESQERGLYE